MTRPRKTTHKLGPRGKSRPPGKPAARPAPRAGKAGRSRRAGTLRSAPAPARLTQEIVIEGAPVDAATGAQAIAPDHSPREALAARAAVGPIARPAKLPTPELQREIEQLLYHQSELLDGKRWQDYIDLFADDGVYWMPVSPEQTEWEGSPSIFAEDKYLMEVRMGRVTHPTAWSQAPMWGTSHVVGNVVIEAAARGEWLVRSRFHMMELRRDTVRHFGGTYRHTLVRQRGQLRIKLQRVDMFNAQAPYDYVLQVWV